MTQRKVSVSLRSFQNGHVNLDRYREVGENIDKTAPGCNKDEAKVKICQVI